MDKLFEKAEMGAARRLGSSFLPIPGSTPVRMEANSGCRFPVYLEAGDPLSSPIADLFCGRQRAWSGQSFASYCKHHQRIAYRPRT